MALAVLAFACVGTPVIAESLSVARLSNGHTLVTLTGTTNCIGGGVGSGFLTSISGSLVTITSNWSDPVPGAPPCQVSATPIPYAAEADAGILPDGTYDVQWTWPAGSVIASVHVTLPNGLQVQGISVTPASITFPEMQDGLQADPVAITVTNRDPVPHQVWVSMLIVACIPEGPCPPAESLEFSFTTDCMPAALSPHATCTIQVSFTPRQPGSHSSSLMVYSGLTKSPVAVALAGVGDPPQVPTLSQWALALLALGMLALVSARMTRS
jgi:hypothetical protein